MESCKGTLNIHKSHICSSNCPFYRILQKSAQSLCSETGVMNSGWLYFIVVLYLHVLKLWWFLKSYHNHANIINVNK